MIIRTQLATQLSLVSIFSLFQLLPSFVLVFIFQFPFAEEQNIVFVVSTTGEGDPPDHALKYWRKMKKKTLPNDYLRHIRYTLLGVCKFSVTSIYMCISVKPVSIPLPLRYNHLYIRTTSTLGPPLHWDHLYIRTTSTLGPPLH